jgi:hypothetical protein
MEILKGDKAPYEGVLVPFDNYRWYQSEVESCKLVTQKQMLACDQADVAHKDSVNHFWMGLVGGLLAGFLAFHK